MLVAASGCILVAAAVLAALLPARGTVAFLVAFLVLAQAMVVAGTGLAGLVVRSLSPATLLATGVLWLVLALGVARLRGGVPRRRVRATGSMLAIRHALAWLPNAAAVLLVGATLIWRVVLALRLPLVDYDGWSYHLVFADVWLQHDQIVGVLQRPWTAGYPANTELLTTWLMAFTRTDAPAGLTSVLPIPLAVVAVTGLARMLGAGPRPAVLAGLVFAMTPALVALAGTSYVDAASVATVAATWYLGLRVVGGYRQAASAALLGIAAGLALGTKGTNVLLVAPVLVAAGLFLLRDLLRAGRLPASASLAPDRAAAAARVAWLVVPVVILGGSWYIKNLVVFGNPLYPFAMGPLPGPTTLTDFAFVPVQLEGKSLPLQLAASWSADWGLDRYPYNVRPGGLGRAWPLLIAAALAGALVLLRRRRLWGLGLVALPALVSLFVMPMPWYARLTLFAPAVALPLGAVALDVLLSWRPRVATLLALAVVAVAAISLAYANVRPNISLRPEVESARSIRGYLGLVLADDDRRRNVGLLAECAGFDVIPAGARVAPGGFNLLHGVVGPALDHVLTDPLPPATSPAELVGAMRARDATWLVTSDGAALDALASTTPELTAHGEICQGGRLWSLGTAPVAGATP